VSSSDSKHEGSEGDPVDPEATRPAQRTTVPPPEDLDMDDAESEEATVMAKIPDELLAESLRHRDDATKGGLRQMFARDSGSGRPPPPVEPEGDALLDMLFEDARDERKVEAAPAAPPPEAIAEVATATPEPAAKARAMPPPPPRRAIPEPVSSGSREPLDTSEGENASPITPVAMAVAEDVADDASMEIDDLAGGAASEPPPALEPSRNTAPIPSRRPPPSAFEREEDASALLLRSHQRDAWVARAEWLRAEAGALSDLNGRARALLVVSELYAMAGEEATARAVADEAREIAPSLPLPHRQARGLLARDTDWPGVLEVLEVEAKSIPTPDARCHGALFGAEIARLIQGDDEGAKKRLDQAQRAAPEDPRAYVQRLAEALAAADPEDGAPAPISKVRVPDAAPLAPLAEAARQVAAHRGVASKTARAAGSTYESLLNVRAAIAAGDHAGAVSGLEGLARAESLAGGAGWLAAVLAAPIKETRARSVEALRGVLDGSHGSAARRALAARAIELGDADAARAAMESPSSDAFSPADRIALAALTGGPRADVDPWLDTLLGDPELAPIASAASAALGDPASASRVVFPAGGLRARTASTLGRAMALTGEGATGRLRTAVLAFVDAAPDHGTARALALELDVDEGNGGKVARAVASFREDADGERERALAGALIAEISGEIERAKAEYERARTLDLTSEAVARAAAAHAAGDAAAVLLTEHGLALDGGSRAAILLGEAAVRFIDAGDDAESKELLTRAAALDPTLPFAYNLGERAARAAADNELLVEWVRNRREASSDPLEQAYDLVREALILTELGGESAEAAVPLFEQALRARPKDAALRDLYERLSPEPLADRAAWREERAAEAPPAEAARLALEAALELERTGDLAGAARCARLAIAAGENQLAPIIVYRAALAGHGTGDLIEALMPRAREASDPIERLETYERLAELDERGRGDGASALLWRRTILEDTPGHLPTLRLVASSLIGAGRDDELEPITFEIAKALDGASAIAHAMLSARLRVRNGSWDDTREPVEIAYRHEPRGIWALRQTAAHARAQGQHQLALEADRQLIERTQRPSEAATLSLRAAQSAVKAGLMDDALAFLGHAIELSPTHLAIHIEMAAVLEQTGNFEGAAASLEAAASAAVSPEERAHNLYKAAILWQDKVNDIGRARAAFEGVVELDPSYGDVFPRLQAIYVAEGARAELAALLKRRLDAVTDPVERVEMEVLRGRALADVGDSAAAKRALAAALEANPDHVEALAAFGDVAASEEDWSGAEQAWIRLARLVPDAARQAAIYLRLGAIYDEHLPNPERAELAYQEILKREPADIVARERLVALFQRQGDAPRAIEQQTLLINAAEAPEAKCVRTTELAGIYETTGDAKKAEATLLQARKTWPKDESALGALASFYQRNGQGPAANMLLERAVADARRALGTGRFEPYLFSTIATVAHLRSRPDAARVAQAAVAALDGAPADLAGAEASAADIKLDDLLAPEVMTPAFRELLKLTGPLLDNAVPFDLAAVRAAPLPLQLADLGDRIRELATAYGVHNVQVFVSSALGSVCVPVSAHPPVLLLGQGLVATDQEQVRAFLVHRALKILQANSAAISRTAPIDLWPLLAAYLKAHSPSWAPQGVDAGKLTDFYGKISRATGQRAVDPQVALLASEVIGSVGNRASTLNTVINGWGNRAGLLAVGDLNIALTGIAWAGGHANAPPAAGKDRMTWIGRNAEARELVVFSVSDAYADARGQLGLNAT
jgi:tetratricopeptide (TPR) repeat protein